MKKKLTLKQKEVIRLMREGKIMVGITDPIDCVILSKAIVHHCTMASLRKKGLLHVYSIPFENKQIFSLTNIANKIQL